MAKADESAPSPRLALTPAEAAQAIGCSRDVFDKHIGLELRWVRRGSTSKFIRLMRSAMSLRSSAGFSLTRRPLYSRSLKPPGSLNANFVVDSTVDVAAVDTSAWKLNLEKRLFRLNVPTVTFIGLERTFLRTPPKVKPQGSEFAPSRIWARHSPCS